MELRQPPHTEGAATADRSVRWLLVVNLTVVLVIAILLVVRGRGSGSEQAAGDLQREVASKLKAAGALDQAAALYERYLTTADIPKESRAKIAYSVATAHLREEEYEKALRWLYEAETIGAGELGNEVSQKIVSCLERLGRHHAAQAALDSRVRLDEGAKKIQRAEDDPVVARIDQEEIHRSEVLRTLDDLPPEMAQSLSDPSQRQELLKQFVAEELLWRKATKLEYDQDPEVQRRYATLLKKLTVSRFVEKEVVGKITVDEADLRNFFEAKKERYKKKPSQKAPPEIPKFEDVRAAVERDYRLSKIQVEYNKLIESELSTADVELHPERLGDDG
jgi:tetratricopeptide (TPR) repeat protein